MAAVGLAVALALIGAGSASAEPTELEKVVLCKVNTSPCPDGKDFPVSTGIHWELKTGTNAVGLLAGSNVVCTSASGSGPLEALLVDESISLFFNNCTVGSESCEVKSLGVSYLAKGELKPGDSGYEILLTRSGIYGNPRFSIECPGFTCVFGTLTALLEQVAGAEDAVLSVLQTLEAEGFFCKAFFGNAVWHAEYLSRCLESGSKVACWLVME